MTRSYFLEGGVYEDLQDGKNMTNMGHRKNAEVTSGRTVESG